MNLGEATNEMKTAFNSKCADLLISAIKTIREPIYSVVRVTALFMKVHDIKPRKEVAMVLTHGLKLFSSQMLVLTGNMLKGFEMLERGASRKDALK